MIALKCTFGVLSIFQTYLSFLPIRSLDKLHGSVLCVGERVVAFWFWFSLSLWLVSVAKFVSAG